MEIILKYLPNIGIIITLIGVIISIYQFREQQKLNLFSEYTKRYQEIMMKMPEICFQEEFDYTKLDDKNKDQTIKAMRLYFDLCSEEYFLYLKNKIDQEVWLEWKSGMTYMLNKPAFQIVWEIINFQSGYYEDFSKLVDELKIKS